MQAIFYHSVIQLDHPESLRNHFFPQVRNDPLANIMKMQYCWQSKIYLSSLFSQNESKMILFVFCPYLHKIPRFIIVPQLR